MFLNALLMVQINVCIGNIRDREESLRYVLGLLRKLLVEPLKTLKSLKILRSKITSS